MDHPLHKAVAECIDRHNLPECKIVKDLACGGQQYVPLFCSKEKSSKTEYCNVDLLIVKDNGIRIIIEIEETNITPIQICGKFLTSALSSYFIHESEVDAPIGMSDSVLFIQILNRSRLKPATAKPDQGENLQESIRKILPIKGSKITEYRLLYASLSDFEDKKGSKCTKLISCIQDALR